MWTYMLCLMLDVHNVSIKPNTDLWSEQHPRKMLDTDASAD